MVKFDFNLSVSVELNDEQAEKVRFYFEQMLTEFIGDNLCIPQTDASVTGYTLTEDSPVEALRELCGEAKDAITDPTRFSEHELACLIAELEDTCN